jgi:hypothetical protein
MANEETTTLEPTQGADTEAQPYVSIFDEPEEQEQSSAEPGEVEEVAEGGSEHSDEPETVDSEWLPSEQLKVFPAEVIAKYAKRFGYSPEDIAADERLANALSKMINSDIHIAEQKRLAEEAEHAEQEEEPEQELEPTQHTDPVQAQAHREAQINQFVDRVTDPKVAVKFTEDFTKAFEIKDPEARGVAVTKALTRGITNLFPDLISAFIGGKGGYLENAIANYMGQNFEGLGESHAVNARTGVVDSLRLSNPAFSAMPKFGTPEFEAAAAKAAKILPGFENVKFYDARGNELPRIEQFKNKAEAMFRILTQQPGAVANAAKAIETGRKVERESVQRKSLGKLGAGQSKGLAKPLTGNDDLFGAAGEVAISQRLVGKVTS